LLAVALIVAIAASMGVLLLRWPVTATLERAYGLDILFKVGGPSAPPRAVCVVAIDDASYEAFGVDRSRTWPRALHGILVEKLAQEGALAVAFDVLFEDAGDVDEDLRFELGLFDAGNVILGATVERVDDPRFRQVRRVEPHEPFADAAAAVAEVELPVDSDGVIREAWLLPDGRSSLALSAYQVGFGDARYDDEKSSRVIHYYGPPRTIDTVSLYQALEPETYLPPGYFKDRLVFVGLSQIAAQHIGDSKDSFGTPFSGGSVGSTFGVEIHATIAANLIDQNEKRMLSAVGETLLLIVIALLGTLLFVALRPFYGAAALLLSQLLVWVVGYQLFARQGVWVPLVIPTLFQLPVAYAGSIVWYYLSTVRDREKIRRAFSFYLAPAMIEKIAADADSLKLGGEEIVGTALFTDIKGFTSLAESMTPVETASMLNRYFSAMTQKLFETEGTLIKYIGDAVFAIWGAPVRQKDHATRGCRAAIQMARSAELPTRIGLHSGPMLVGNLGSNQRFDYTAIGDTINLAARLESLNKSTGTQLLVSGETLSQTDGSLIVRALGHVR
jgi:adenylate cyclase